MSSIFMDSSISRAFGSLAPIRNTYEWRPIRIAQRGASSIIVVLPSPRGIANAKSPPPESRARCVASLFVMLAPAFFESEREVFFTERFKAAESSGLAFWILDRRNIPDVPTRPRADRGFLSHIAFMLLVLLGVRVLTAIDYPACRSSWSWSRAIWTSRARMRSATTLARPETGYSLAQSPKGLR